MADVSGAYGHDGLHGRKFDKRKWLNVTAFTGQENPPTQKTPRRNQRMWKNQNRPSYSRLDSTGENSASSTEDLSCAFSPGIQASNRCRPRFQERRTFTETHQGGGLLDKVKTVIGARNQYLPPERNATRNLAHRTPSNNPDARLASLDSVAEKFTNMSMSSMTNMNHQHWGNSVPHWQHQQYANGFGGPAPHGAQGQWGRTTNVPHDRNHTQIFHPYQGINQPPLISSTQNYQRNFYPPPWQRMLDGNHRCYPPPFYQGFNQFAQPWQHQQRSHPPFPWQQWIGPRMMQACGNQGSMAHQGPMTRQYQQKNRSPAKKQRWNRSHGNQKRTCPQPKSGSNTDKKKISSSQTFIHSPSDSKTSVDQPIQGAELKDDETLDDTRKDGDLLHVRGVGDSAIYPLEESVRTDQDKEQITIQSKNIECQTLCKQEVSGVHDTDYNITERESIQRHSSIELILSDYKVPSGTRVEVTALSASSDSEDSYGDSDSAVETNADLWESFTATDDPYNPLCGWRCSDNIQEACSGVTSSVRDCHVDSGTDEGDNWSETDSDDDYDSGDDFPEDDFDSSLPRSLKLSDPQLEELRDNLSSTPKTPKKKSAEVSLHHPSVAFILGSTLSSSEEEDDDDDWDTLDGPSSVQDDPLWDSFNRPKDPYSPMEAWKCHASNLSCTIIPPSSSQSNLKRKDSVEGLKNILLASTEREAASHQPCKNSSSRDSDGESFAIATVRVYAARDDMDLASPTSNISGAAMKRVASASCLKRVQLTPQNKASKKVRFCPNSSFIVLVEKDPPSCANNPSQAAENDWQACARDRMRFRARIDQLSPILDPVLTNKHRERVYASRISSEGCR